MSRSATDFLQGTLELLVLKTLSHGSMHGYRIARFLEAASGETLIVEEGSLYPALYRMERRGWLEAEWRTSELGRRAKFYRLTPKGRRRLAADTLAWSEFAATVSKLLTPPLRIPSARPASCATRTSANAPV